MLRNLLAAGAFVAMSSTIIYMMVGSFFLIRASCNRAPSAPYRWMVKYFWLNAVLFPDQLSSIGLKYRRWYLVFLRASLGSGAVMIALVLALALLKP